MGFLPQPVGGRETTTTNTETQIKIPLGIMIKSTLIDSIKIVASSALGYLFLGLIAGLIKAEAGACRGYWSCLWGGIVFSVEVLKYTFWLPLMLCVFALNKHGTRLVHYRWAPEQFDPHYPPPYKGREPSEAGQTWWDLYAARHTPPDPEPAPQLSPMPPVVVQRPDGTLTDPEVPPMPAEDGARKLLLLLRRSMNRVDSFSRQHALDLGFSRADWDALAEWCQALDRQFYKPKQGLTTTGKRWAVGVINRLVIDNGTNGRGHPPTEAGGMGMGNSQASAHPSHPIP